MVYLAEQEEPVRREVAVKIVKIGMDTESVIARFNLERRTLAQMDHPHIARVLDAGATSSGRLFFVMEFVDGRKITDFCDAHRLDVKKRLLLFMQVCRAIHHAHQKGVIHRDIKPSNVLVRFHESVPAPTVIDFGIAKATAGGGGGGGAGGTLTRTNHAVGTPAYMSPEQADGGMDLDTRADIYSLGLLLYELLGGLPAFRFKPNATTAEMLRIIREEEVAPPSRALARAEPELAASIARSRATDYRHLESMIGGDLDWIVLKAIEKDRARRYESAVGLAVDIQRYLDDEPVLARPPSRGYRLGKLVRRNKLVFVAGSIAVFGLAAGFGTSTWMFFRERDARREQSRRRADAELRGLVDRAAVKIGYREIEEADRLLAGVPSGLAPASMEAANTFRAVANWHVQGERLREASERLAAMARALSSVDDSDEPTVSLGVMGAAIMAAYVGEADRYEEIRGMMIGRFGRTSNPVVAEEVLKACLVLPPDLQTLQALAPLAELVDLSITSKQGLIGNDPHHLVAGCLSLSTFHLRSGDRPKAAYWAGRGLDVPRPDEARRIALLSLRAMASGTMAPVGNPDSFESLQRAVDAAISGKRWTMPPTAELAFRADWLNAILLFREAAQVVDGRGIP